MTDKIVLRGIECYAHGGVTESERDVGQRYRVDIELDFDTRKAALSDSIVDTVHYGRVHDTVVTSLREAPFNLLEAGAERISRRILEGFPVEAVTVRLAKLLPPIDGVVAVAGVEITRSKHAD